MKENQNIEWKQSWRDEYLKWICGFANAEGGTLVIGKNDQGEVVGVANAARLLEDIPNKVRDIDLIRSTCLDYGSPAPRFDCDSTGFLVEFPFAGLGEAEKTSVKTSVKTPVETPVKTPTAILLRLAANPTMTLAEVAAEIGKSLSAVERASAKLVTEGKLRYHGPRKGGHWEVLK